MSAPAASRDGALAPGDRPLSDDAVTTDQASDQAQPIRQPEASVNKSAGPESCIARTTRMARDQLKAVGFARFTPLLTPAEENALEELAHECNMLPSDPYDKTEVRRRRYGRAYLDPNARDLRWAADEINPLGEPVAVYTQDAKNPEFENVERIFPALTPTMRSNLLLNNQIWRDFALTDWRGSDRNRLKQVGVHFIGFAPTADQAAVATPNMLHRDGEPYTIAHLISRVNLAGGQNWIAPPEMEGRQPEMTPEHILASFEITGPFESYAVRDSAVTHHVDPMRRLDPTRPGERVILLIDFSPLYPRVEP